MSDHVTGAVNIYIFNAGFEPPCFYMYCSYILTFFCFFLYELRFRRSFAQLTETNAFISPGPP
jgi:hypothetical protein